MARFVEVISTTSGGAERRVKMPIDQFVTELAELGGTVPVKATGAEVDTGSNDTKFITPLALEDSDYIKEADLPAGDSVALETPTGDVNGVNDDFVFTAPPIVVFRNGVNETRNGTIATNTFTFDTPPETGDSIEGLV